MQSAAVSKRAESYERHCRELVNYATRLVLRESMAEELVDEAALPGAPITS